MRTTLNAVASIVCAVFFQAQVQGLDAPSSDHVFADDALAERETTDTTCNGKDDDGATRRVLTRLNQGSSNLLQVNTKRLSKAPTVFAEMSDRSVERGPLNAAFNQSTQYVTNSSRRIGLGQFTSLLDALSSRTSTLVVVFIFLIAACILFFMIVRVVDPDDDIGKSDAPSLGCPPHSPQAPVFASPRSPLPPVRSVSPPQQTAPRAASFGNSPPRTILTPSFRERLPPSASQRHPSGLRAAPDQRPAAGGKRPPVAQAPMHLCPGLVVPQGSECVLAVFKPPRPDAAAVEVATLNVRDLDGASVLQADVALPPLGGTGFEVAHRPLVVLRGAFRQGVRPMVAYCKATHEAAGKRACIYDARDELFAVVARGPSEARYVLTGSRTSMRLYFEGDPAKHTVNVTNDERVLLADTSPFSTAFDPTGSYYKLRVISDHDVGLMLCALLSIECLDLS